MNKPMHIALIEAIIIKQKVFTFSKETDGGKCSYED